MFFSRHGGLAETRYVFLDGNHLAECFASAEQFVIGETGFGSGLNFIATVDCWLQTAPANACLHYISIEKHPFTAEDLAKAQSAWPELQPITSELLEAYPPLVHGFHHRALCAGRVRLSLLFGDAVEQLTDLNAKVDAWFLDGFAPAKNQALWTNRLFQLIAARTAIGGSFATFTAAGDVRRGLQDAGFTVSKRAGFGKKREMLIGSLAKKIDIPSAAPWFEAPPAAATTEKHAIVIGAGMAGITTASALAGRGWRVTLIDQHVQVAMAASGNPAGVVMPRLSADMSIDARFFLSAFLFTTAWLQHNEKQYTDIGWHAEGVVQLLAGAKATGYGKHLPDSVVMPLDAAMAGELIGTRVERGGILYPQAGWLQPRQLCEALLQQQPAISFRASTQIKALEYRDGVWQVRDDSNVMASAPVVILANGCEAGRLLPEIDSNLHAVRGQLTYVQGSQRTIKRPVCYDGYAIPLAENQYCIGASYDRSSRAANLCEAEQQANLDALRQALPDFSYAGIRGGRVAFRASSQDHLPLVGAVPDTEFYTQQYGDLYHGRPAHKYPPARYQPGLYLNTGHGSRGLTTCPLAAELLTGMINGEPVAVAEDIRLALHPARFVVRNLKRRRIAE